jgi:hypothetical protein
MPFPPLSTTVACREAKAVLIATLCEAPPVALIADAAPGLLVNVNAAGEPTPVTVALTEYVPAVLLAVNTGAVATPLELVVTVAVAPLPGAANVPLAPVEGAVNVTVALLTRFPLPSFTVTAKFVVKAVLIVVLCGVPAVAVMLAGAPALLVSENAAFVETLPTDAFTV